MSEKRASLNPREARLAHEALWLLHGSDESWITDEVQALVDKLERYAGPIHYPASGGVSVGVDGRRGKR